MFQVLFGNSVPSSGSSTFHSTFWLDWSAAHFFRGREHLFGSPTMAISNEFIVVSLAVFNQPGNLDPIDV
jgi:hypothetical protein